MIDLFVLHTVRTILLCSCFVSIHATTKGGSLAHNTTSCSATNRLITAKNHASVQINIGHVDENDIYNGQFSTFALCGFICAQGDADSALDRLWQKKKVEVKQ